MNLVPSPEQRDFAAALHDLLADSGPSFARLADSGPSFARLAEVGVTGLAVPARWDGHDATPADLVVAFEELGHHAVPGPLAESVAAVPALLAALPDPQPADKWLPELAAGRAVATLAAPPWLPYAVDAHTADLVLLVSPESVRLARPGAAYPSMDHTRLLFELTPGETLAAGPEVADGAARALDLGVLACAAQLLGAGRALLEMSVGYAKTRVQFGRPIGQFQAVKHALADVAVGLEFARPLLYGAAVSLAAEATLPGPGATSQAAGDASAVPSPRGTAARDVSAAKVACSEAAHRAARAALQVHGAIGYTQEHELGRFVTKVRALALAWGTPADHRSRVTSELTR
jgi:hypothetical protein